MMEMKIEMEMEMEIVQKLSGARFGVGKGSPLGPVSLLNPAIIFLN